MPPCCRRHCPPEVQIQTKRSGASGAEVGMESLKQEAHPVTGQLAATHIAYF